METDSRTIFSGFSHVMLCAFCARVKRKITFHIKFWLRKSIWPLLLYVEENEFIDFLCVCDINDFIYTLCWGIFRNLRQVHNMNAFIRGANTV